MPAMRSAASRARQLAWRVYEDYLQPDRFEAYQALLQAAREHGYEAIALDDWVARVRSGQPPRDGGGRDDRLLILRHDIDTDPGTCREWLAIETALGARASYFFRLTTCDDAVMRELIAAGAHVSYHFEELADVAKEAGLRDARDLTAWRTRMQDRLAANLARLRDRHGVPMDIVCSHGDWINRRLGVKNSVLLDDPAFRAAAGVACEVYDTDIVAPLAGYFSDHVPPRYWRNGDPIEAVRAGRGPVCVLTHPRHWRAHPRSNLAETARRVREAIAYRIGA